MYLYKVAYISNTTTSILTLKMISLSCSFNFSNHCTLVCNEMILKSLCNLWFFLGMPILLKIIFLELTDTKYLLDIFNAIFIVHKYIQSRWVRLYDPNCPYSIGKNICTVHNFYQVYFTKGVWHDVIDLVVDCSYLISWTLKMWLE